MKKNIIGFVIVFQFVLTNKIFCQQPLSASFIYDSLDNYMTQALNQWQVPGAAVAIISNHKTIFMKGFGVCGSGKSNKVNENTLFMIGSNTKAFTGTSLAWLAERGLCSLDDNVVQWIPDFKMKDTWVTSHLTLTDILCHRIGMETFQGDFMYWTSDLTLNQVIEKFGMLTPDYGFRSRWGYTNAGFAIAGECIEKISGRPWETFIHDDLLEPLQMNRTLTSSANIATAENAARPYTMADGKLIEIPYPMIDNLAPAGSISSSVSDMSHWVMCLLDSGKFGNKQVIPWSVINRTRKPESIEGTQSNHGLSHFKLYGLGWELQDYNGYEIVSHTGGVNGFVSSVTLLPEKGIGIIVFTNTDTNELYSAAKWDILNSLLGLPFQNINASNLKSYNNSTIKNNSWLVEKRDSVALNLKPTVPLNNFTGHYVNDAYGFADIHILNNSLILTFEHHPYLSGKLESLGHNRFLCTYNDPEFGVKIIPFEISENKVTGFDLHVADFIEFTSYNFKKIN